MSINLNTPLLAICRHFFGTENTKRILSKNNQKCLLFKKKINKKERYSKLGKLNALSVVR